MRHAAGGRNRKNITAVFSLGLQISIRSKSQKARQRTWERTKVLLSKTGLQARALLGSPSLKRIVDAPCVSSFHAIKEEITAQSPTCKTKWPRGLDQPNFSLSAPGNGPIWIAGKVTENELFITVAKEFKVGQETVRVGPIRRRILAAVEKWRLYPWDVHVVDAEIVPDPFPPPRS